MSVEVFIEPFFFVVGLLEARLFNAGAAARARPSLPEFCKNCRRLFESDFWVMGENLDVLFGVENIMNPLKPNCRKDGGIVA